MATARRSSSRDSATQSRKPKASDEDEAAPSGRPLWSGSISFGLLQIPVSVYPAESRNELRFHQLDKNDMAPIGYQRINKTTGKKVEWNDIVKGYEYEKGQFVVLSDADFKAANVEATQTIDIQDFVDAEDIHPAHYETPYYLAPTKKSQKAYAVLREALRRQKKAAVATFVLRSREHLAAIFPQGDALMLEILRFPHEIRSTDNLALPAPGSASLKLHPKELEMAERLIEGMSTKWDPSKYHDQYRDDLLAKIEEKAKTGKITPSHEPRREAQAGNVVDIMSLLKRSVERAEKAKKPSSDGAARRSGEARGGVKKASAKRKSSGKAA